MVNEKILDFNEAF